MENNNQNEISKVIKISSFNSEATFKGPKLIKLILNDELIIKPEEENENQEIKKDQFLSSGCFLMYPWVGRINKDEKIKEITKLDIIDYPFRDGNQNPIHGFYADIERKVIKKTESRVSFTPKVANDKQYQNFPNFTEQFEIFENRLEIKTIFYNNNTHVQYFAYGYHPYLSFPSTKINNIILKTNLNKKIKLTDELVPLIENNNNSFILKDYNLNNKIENSFYDDLFYFDSKLKSESELNENPYISLINEESNKTINIESNNDKNCSSSINLDYFQIYTPKSRDCIAIEPMTSPSNSFNINFPNNLMSINPNEEKIGKFTITII